jgi:hypothetical protein
MKHSIYLLLIGCFSVTGCSKTIESVDYYKSHKVEMEKVLKECGEVNPFVTTDKNCLNADKARGDIISDAIAKGISNAHF